MTPEGGDSHVGGNAARSSSTASARGERYDANAGLQYLNARYYDPKLGMFIQPDWFEVTKAGGGTNRYAYAGNDPVNARDLEGNSAEHPTNGERAVDAVMGWFGDLLEKAFPSHDWDSRDAITNIPGISLVPVIGDAIAIEQAKGPLGKATEVAMALGGPIIDGLNMVGKGRHSRVSRTNRAADSPVFSGTYEPNSGKHGSVARGRISREPANPQRTLEVSKPVGGNSKARIGYDSETGEIVVFQETSENVYHGYVPENGWKDLTQGQRNALVEAGIFKNTGKLVR